VTRRISQTRKLALDQLAAYYRWTASRGSGSNAGMGHSALTGGVRRYARLWLLATGELPTGVHEVPWTVFGTRWESTEVNYNRLHPSSLPRGFSGPPAPPAKYGMKAVKAAAG